MKLSRRFYTVLLVLILFVFTASASAALANDLVDILPGHNSVPGWAVSGAVQKFNGENLFQMIDGGADIYHEYGFQQVVSQDYSNGFGNLLTVEIYQMASPAAAYGMYSFKIGTSGRAVDLGQQAYFEEYYVNIWQGDLLITIIGSDSNQKTVQAIEQMGRTICGSYSVSGAIPTLAQHLTQGELSLFHAKYVLGDLGVMNSYVFDSDNIFHVQEGMLGQLEDCQVFVFRYDDNVQRETICSAALSKMISGRRFSNAEINAAGTLLTDRKGKQVIVSQAGVFVTVVIGESSEKIIEVNAKLLSKLSD